MSYETKIQGILENFKQKLTLDGRKKVFEDGKPLSSNYIIDKSDPEDLTRNFLIDKILFDLFKIELIATNKHFRGPKELRKVDYAVKFGDKKFIIEAKPINSNLFDKSPDGAVNQIKGLFTLAEVKEEYAFGIATDGLKWVFIDKNSKIVYHLDIVKDLYKIKEILTGKEEISSEKFEEEITKKFYDWYNALLHGGRYRDHENRIRTISPRDCLVENILFVSKPEEREQIAQIIMDRSIFIKFLQSKKEL